MIMRRVAITGIGIVSSIGNNVVRLPTHCAMEHQALLGRPNIPNLAFAVRCMARSKWTLPNM